MVSKYDPLILCYQGQFEDSHSDGKIGLLIDSVPSEIGGSLTIVLDHFWTIAWYGTTTVL